MTILRAELVAMMIGIRMVNYVQKQMDIEEARFFIWTDSQTVIY